MREPTYAEWEVDQAMAMGGAIALGLESRDGWKAVGLYVVWLVLFWALRVAKRYLRRRKASRELVVTINAENHAGAAFATAKAAIERFSRKPKADATPAVDPSHTRSV